MNLTNNTFIHKGLNFSGADLSRLDLRYINFKMANLSRCNLTHANLCCSNLERADLSGANLDVNPLAPSLAYETYLLLRVNI